MRPPLADIGNTAIVLGTRPLEHAPECLSPPLRLHDLPPELLLLIAEPLALDGSLDWLSLAAAIPSLGFDAGDSRVWRGFRGLLEGVEACEALTSVAVALAFGGSASELLSGCRRRLHVCGVSTD